MKPATEILQGVLNELEIAANQSGLHNPALLSELRELLARSSEPVAEVRESQPLDIDGRTIKAAYLLDQSNVKAGDKLYALTQNPAQADN